MSTLTPERRAPRDLLHSEPATPASRPTDAIPHAVTAGHALDEYVYDLADVSPGSDALVAVSQKDNPTPALLPRCTASLTVTRVVRRESLTRVYAVCRSGRVIVADQRFADPGYARILDPPLARGGRCARSGPPPDTRRHVAASRQTSRRSEILPRGIPDANAGRRVDDVCMDMTNTAIRTAGRPTRRPVGPPAPLMVAKLMVGGLLGATLVIPAAGGFHGQALWLRVVVYAVGLSVLPLVWRRRAPTSAYPVAADVYLLVPFGFDAVGNTLGFYARIDNFDNFAHLVGTVALTGFCGALLTRRSNDTALRALAAAGAASMFGIGIEVAEWTAFSHPVATGFAAYRDTVGDLAMDGAGSILGACLLIAADACRRPYRTTTAFPIATRSYPPGIRAGRRLAILANTAVVLSPPVPKLERNASLPT